MSLLHELSIPALLWRVQTVQEQRLQGYSYLWVLNGVDSTAITFDIRPSHQQSARQTLLGGQASLDSLDSQFNMQCRDLDQSNLHL